MAWCIILIHTVPHIEQLSRRAWRMNICHHHLFLSVHHVHNKIVLGASCKIGLGARCKNLPELQGTSEGIGMECWNAGKLPCIAKICRLAGSWSLSLPGPSTISTISFAVPSYHISTIQYCLYTCIVHNDQCCSDDPSDGLSWLNTFTYKCSLTIQASARAIHNQWLLLHQFQIVIWLSQMGITNLNSNCSGLGLS